ncbi:MAG: UDP-N-acetylmuramoyl-L-alanine--D-glutamate ligase [Ruminiclostridium sp.]|nr:UDP-N-acetylmuramoyl-L-alanine--D-glutamate ligase [Ruminiclostridium sp.]
MREKLKAFFKGKRVLILGFGREGKSTLDLIKDFDCEIGISDQNPNFTDDVKKYNLYSGDSYLEPIKEYDIVMKTPGIALLDKIDEKDKEKITGQTDLFLRFCPNYTIGVTGTKGKSTTSSLIAHILNYCGKNAVLIGNIGIPPLSVVDTLDKDTIVVMEMSCHQLEYVKASPRTAVLLNVYEEHLDHYVDFNAYRSAKENIYRYQVKDDLLVCNKALYTNAVASLPSKKATADMEEKADIYVSDKDIIVEGKPISIEKLAPKLEGKHNLYNIGIALCAALHQGCDFDKAVEAVGSFNGLEHRMEYVKTVKGVRYINDSISTIPLATINAVNTFNADTVIIGGMDRGINYDILVDFLNSGKVENIICLPDSGYRIADSLNTKANVYRVKDMEEAVAKAYEATKRCCVLSPAAASYGFYKNFEERGKHFKDLVDRL